VQSAQNWIGFQRRFKIQSSTNQWKTQSSKSVLLWLSASFDEIALTSDCHFSRKHYINNYHKSQRAYYSKNNHSQRRHARHTFFTSSRMRTDPIYLSLLADSRWRDLLRVGVVQCHPHLNTSPLHLVRPVPTVTAVRVRFAIDKRLAAKWLCFYALFTCNVEQETKVDQRQP
jgi:hypothetical protein